MLGAGDTHTSTMRDLDATARLKDKDPRSRLSLFLTKSGSHENVSRNKKTPSPTKNISLETALRWSDSFDDLLKCPDGVETFSQFLRTEFSEENIEFWLACEDYKTLNSEAKLISRAKHIYSIYIQVESPKEVNIDHATRAVIQSAMARPTPLCFEAAQGKVFSLMKKDCYPRFLASPLYLRLSRRQLPGGAVMTRRRSRSCVFADRAEAQASTAW